MLKRTLFLAIVVFAFTSNLPSFAGAPDKAFLLGFLEGEYRLVGQRPGSGTAYVGCVSFRQRAGRFEITRTVAGVRTRATATIETTGEGSAVLKSRFVVEGVDYEATYLWRSDLDNYPRLTGYVYRVGASTISPGLEALFHIPPAPAK